MSGNIYSINAGSSALCCLSSSSSLPAFPPTEIFSTSFHRHALSPQPHFPPLSFSLSPPWQINRSHVSPSCTPSACSSERTPPCLASVATWAAPWLAEAEKLQREEPRVADRHSVSETKTQGVLPAAVPQGWGLEMENTDWVPGWLLDKSVRRVFTATHFTSVLQARCHHMLDTSKAQMITSFKIQAFYSWQTTYILHSIINSCSHFVRRDAAVFKRISNLGMKLFPCGLAEWWND